MTAAAATRAARWKALVKELPEEAPAILEDLVSQLGHWNKRIKLTAPGTDEELARRLVDDGLQLVAFIKGNTLIDVGSGPGIPALVLAAALPHLEVRSVEPISKKVAFTRSFLSRHPSLAARVKPFTGRAEGRADERWGQAETVVSRAFTAPEAWVKIGAPLVGEGGRLIVTLANGTGEEADPVARTLGLEYAGQWRGDLFGVPRAVRWYERGDVPRGTSD